MFVHYVCIFIEEIIKARRFVLPCPVSVFKKDDENEMNLQGCFVYLKMEFCRQPIYFDY